MNIAALLLAVLVAVSCASLKPIPTPPSRIHQKGYSIMPLNEEGWDIGNRTPVELLVGKRGKDRDHTYIYHTTLVAMNSDLNYQDRVKLLRKQLELEKNPQRFNEVKSSIEPKTFNGNDCIRIHLVNEDKNAKVPSSRTGSMVTELLALSCPHPKDRQVIVHVTYSERYWPDDRDERIYERADLILSSLQFEDF